MIIYTDGSCLNNPGPGGWGFILIGDEYDDEVSGGEKYTTNNRMELTAVIEAIKYVKTDQHIDIYSDSQYVVKGITEWVDSWVKKNWKKVKNVDLWRELHSLNSEYDISWNWVKAHSTNEYNNRVDLIARERAMEYNT